MPVMKQHIRPGFAAMLAASAACATTGANAATAYWSAAASACVPDSGSIQGNRYATVSDGYVAHATGNLDLIALICGIAPNTGGTLPNTLSMTLLDATGTATTARAQAQLIRVQRSNGARALVASVSSDSLPNATLTNQRATTFAHPLNFTTNYYFVRIELDRSVATQIVRGIGVSLGTP
jgi:hypothetical protein